MTKLLVTAVLATIFMVVIPLFVPGVAWVSALAGVLCVATFLILFMMRGAKDRVMDLIRQVKLEVN